MSYGPRSPEAEARRLAALRAFNERPEIQALHREQAAAMRQKVTPDAIQRAVATRTARGTGSGGKIVWTPEMRARESERKRQAVPGYHGAHIRHGKVLPRVCAFCGRTDGRLHCALRRDVPAERILQSKHGAYSIDPADYLRLCPDCHSAYDGNVPPKARRRG